jgi:dTDP-3-amino-3,4,6-trideoxy-alpha-D-glucose transaminase
VRNVPFLDLSSSSTATVDAIDDVLRSGTFILGPRVETFENAFAAFVGTEHCVGVGSGTDAICLVLRAMGIGPGDEVIVPAYTAVATWMAVLEVGATPVGVDADPSTYLMDPARAAAARTARTKCAIAVHLFGRPADVDALVDALPGVPVVEDCAQAHGARCGTRMVGSLGYASTFSFYPTKNLGAVGDGGAVVTNDGQVAEQVRLLRSFGWRDRSESLIVAGNSRLDEIQAAVLSHRLQGLSADNERRQAIARAYSAGLALASQLWVPPAEAWSDSVFHLYPIRHSKPSALMHGLKERGVGTLQHYVPLPHQTQALRHRLGIQHFPDAEALASRSISIPLYPSLSESAVEHVVAAVIDTCEELADA